MSFTGDNGLSDLLFQAGPQCSQLGHLTVAANSVLSPLPKLLLSDGIKLLRAGSNLVWISGASPQSDSFEDLAMPLFDQLYNFARWLTQNREEAEDLVQETYAKALKGFSSFQMGTNFRAWMYRILRNTFLSSRTGLRAASTVPLDSEDDGPELGVESETPETILTRRSNSRLVQSASEWCFNPTNSHNSCSSLPFIFLWVPRSGCPKTKGSGQPPGTHSKVCRNSF